MRIAVLILGLILGAVMATQTLDAATLSNLINDPLNSDLITNPLSPVTEPFTADVEDVELLMALLWVIGIAFVLGAPIVSMLAFGTAAALGVTSDVVTREQFSALGLWGVLSVVLAVLSASGVWEKLRDDERKAHTRAQLEVIAESVGRQDPPG